MLKPPGSTIPGMTDTLDFVKNLWGSMHLPGTGLGGMSAMSAPPMSIEDLDKRIADLKAVESWLNLNLGMLRASIQAIEVQRGTLVTLQSMSSTMAEAMRQSGVSAEKMASMPFGSFFGQPGAGGKPAEPPAFFSAPPASPASPASAAAPNKQAGGATGQPGTATPAGAAGADAPLDGAAAAAAAMGMPAAMAWWNMLQDQFTQAVSAAMTPTASGAAATASPAGSAPDAGAAARAAGNGDKAAAGKAADGGAPASGAPDGAAADAKAAGNGGAGKARTSKPKADKA